MTKVRVHELAKELNKSNKEILDFLQEKKVEVKSHMSILEENQEKLGKSSLKNTAEQNKEAEKKEKPVEENVEKKPKKKSNILYYIRLTKGSLKQQRED